MKKIVLILVLLPIACVISKAQNSSFIVFGDLHYNLHSDHDTIFLKNRGLMQESLDYAEITKKHWMPFMEVIRKKAAMVKPPVKAIIQLGDLSEGLAGSDEKARQMNAHTVKALRETQMPVPWLVVKGNHETYGPGANKAYSEFFVPFFREQTNDDKISSANYSYNTGNVQIICLDIYDYHKTDIIAFLEDKFSSSKAKYKFVALHEPVVPVTGLCWYVNNRDEERRNKLMEVIAKNKAIVLCGHLHYYSVLSRETKFGPLVQVMVNSVVKDSSYQTPSHAINEFGPELVESTTWSPETMDERRLTLSKEKKYVTSYKRADLPGYAIIKINDEEETILLEYYAAFGKKPYDIVNLTGLLTKKE